MFVQLRNSARHERLSARVDSSSRSAFTLVELLIVLGVLVVLASLSWPRLMRYIEENTLKQNVELVRRELANARMLAIESGLSYQFRFEPNAHDFVILPLDRPETITSDSQKTPQTKVKTIVGHLATGIQFEAATSSNSNTTSGGQRLDEVWLSLLKDGALYTDTVWSAPILFRPNGSSEDAQLVIRDSTGRNIRLTVRGLTGGVRVEKLKLAEAQP